MSGAQQTTFMNQRSFGPPLPAIGAAYEGGFFAGQISTAGNGIADYNLVVGPASSAQTGNNSGTSLQFKTSDTGGDSTSSIDGPTNSAAMNSATYPAGQFCETLTIGGFSDWYLPATNELDVCYFNLKPTTTLNSTSPASGINSNAVPARPSAYTSGTPIQTSAVDFQTGNAEAFFAGFYWTSSEQVGTSANAVIQTFNDGSQNPGVPKTNLFCRVRAIRRVAV